MIKDSDFTIMESDSEEFFAFKLNTGDYEGVIFRFGKVSGKESKIVTRQDPTDAKIDFEYVALVPNEKNTLEELDKDGVVAPLESLPEFCSHNFVWSAIAVLHLHVWFLGHRVQVFMHRLKQHREHLQGVVLGEPLESDCLSGDPVFDVPRRHVPLLAEPNVIDQFSEGHSQAATRAEGILLVDVLDVDLVEEEFEQWF